MNKPFTIIIQETEQKIVEIINNSQLHTKDIKNILQEIYEKRDRRYNEEIVKYNKEQKK